MGLALYMEKGRDDAVGRCKGERSSMSAEVA